MYILIIRISEKDHKTRKTIKLKVGNLYEWLYDINNIHLSLKSSFSLKQFTLQNKNNVVIKDDFNLGIVSEFN